MPTNQSSPWGGATLRACSNAESPTTATSVSAHAKTVAANKVPFRKTSLELSKRKDQAKSLPSNVASSAFPLRHTTVASSVLSAWENGDGNKTITQIQFTTVPDGSPTLPQQFNGIQIPNKVLVAELKQTGSSLTETNANFSMPKKECRDEFNIQLQRCVSLQTSQPGNGLGMCRGQAAVGDAPLGLGPFMSNCHQDLFIKGKPTLQKNNKVMVSIDVTHCNIIVTRQTLVGFVIFGDF